MNLKNLFRFPWYVLISISILIFAATAGCAPENQAQSQSGTVSPPLPTELLPTVPVPSPSPSPTPAGCQELHGRVEENPIQTEYIPDDLLVRVYLPPCYTEHPASPYPVLFLLHGQGSSKDQWEQLGITLAADHLINSGRIAPMLIVLPYEKEAQAFPYDTEYDSALVKDLLPWLMQAYPACIERSCRAIGGLSRGAGWAMHIGLSHPDLFKAIGAHSFPSFYSDSTRLPYLVREIPQDLLPDIWMDSGKSDLFISEAKHYEELLTQYKVPHEWHIFEGEHNEAYWSAHLEEYLEWYGAEIAPPA